ncbi:MAG: type IV pilus twitching motility protein PilT [Planctomycetota bacterium]
MNLIRPLLDTVIQQGASDLHLSVGRAPCLRLHGQMQSLEAETLTETSVEQLVREITPDRNWRELEEVGTTDFGLAFEDKARFRVSVFKQKGAYQAALRLIPNDLLSFDQIGLPDSIKPLLSKTRGLILVTGPTGSGKTTTLASMIDYVNETLRRHIVTVEDPIEYYHTHKKSLVTQREVGNDTTTFAEALRRVLRQDPDVILLGEMRDLETIHAAISAAETGHLVFGTLHTTGSARTMDRIIDAFPPDQQEQVRAQLAVSIIAVISQVLLPRKDGQGRCAAFETMLMTPAIENHIRKNETFKIFSVIQTNRRLGMVLLDDSLHDLYKAGKISAEVALEVAQHPRDMAEKLGL